MLILLFSIAIYLNIFYFSYNLLLIQLVFTFLYLSTNLIHIFFVSSYLFNSYILLDNFRWFLMFLLLIIMFLMYSFIVEEFFLIKSIVLRIVFLLGFCAFVFTTNNFIVFYVSYECSLLPIMYIIIKFGKYSNRYLRSLILIAYTSLFAVPFLFVLGSLYRKLCSFSILFLDTSVSFNSFNFFVFSLIRFFIFLVKLPCYGLHFWLPLAHVEAPTAGSMILAGILLKLRVIGMLRFSKLITDSFIIYYLQSYFLIRIVCATLLCCFQSDFKRLVAYSSISHIRLIPLLVLSNTKMFFNCRVLIALFHGFSSVFMFILVSQVYTINKTRQIYYVHGLIFFYPLLTLLRVIRFMGTLSMPPFPRFLSEVIAFICIASFNFLNMWILFRFSFISGIYRLQWLTIIFFSKRKNYINYSSIPFSNKISLFYIIIIFMPFLFLINFVIN